MRRPGSMAVAEDEDEVRRPAEVEAEEKREENSIQKNVNVERVTVWQVRMQVFKNLFVTIFVVRVRIIIFDKSLRLPDRRRAPTRELPR